MFVHETCAAAVLIILTLWLQCGGIATLITWFRGAVAGDTDKFGLFRTAVHAQKSCFILSRLMADDMDMDSAGMVK